MTGRQSIYVEGAAHASPIPAACRLGPLLVSSGIFGLDPGTGKPAATLEEQCALMFASLRRIAAAGGARLEDIAKVTIWMADPAQRQVLNREWERCFPERASRPARHTLRGQLEHGALVQCEFLAWVAPGAP